MTLIYNYINSHIVGLKDEVYPYSCDRKMEFVEKGFCKYLFLNYFSTYLPGLMIYAYKPLYMLHNTLHVL